MAGVELLEVGTVVVSVFVRGVVSSVVLGVCGVGKGVNSVSLLVRFGHGFCPQKVFLVEVGFIREDAADADGLKVRIGGL